MASKHLITVALRIVNSLLLLAFLGPTLAQNNLLVGFYNENCSQAESIVRGVITSHFATDKSLPAAGAGGPQYNLPTGRRDGRISSIDNVDLPGPSFQVSQAAAAFANKGLTMQDMVILLGAHTVGVAHCIFFSNRLYSFQGTGAADPSMDPTLVAVLKKVCPSPTSSSTQDPTVFLDQNTSFAFDNSYYQQLQLKHGILQIDEELASDGSTKGIVTSLASDGTKFSKSFVGAIIKLGNTEVLTGQNGEIRRNCRVVNPVT